MKKYLLAFFLLLTHTMSLGAQPFQAAHQNQDDLLQMCEKGSIELPSHGGMEITEAEFDKEVCKKIVMAKTKGPIEQLKTCHQVFEDEWGKKQSCIEYFFKESPCLSFYSVAKGNTIPDPGMELQFKKCLAMQDHINQFDSCRYSSKTITCREGSYILKEESSESHMSFTHSDNDHWKDVDCKKIQKENLNNYQGCMEIQAKASKFSRCKRETGVSISCGDRYYKYIGAHSPVNRVDTSRGSGKGFISYPSTDENPAGKKTGQER